jgi:hypothetical protein
MLLVAIGFYTKLAILEVLNKWSISQISRKQSCSPMNISFGLWMWCNTSFIKTHQKPLLKLRDVWPPYVAMYDGSLGEPNKSFGCTCQSMTKFDVGLVLQNLVSYNKAPRRPFGVSIALLENVVICSWIVCTCVWMLGIKLTPRKENFEDQGVCLHPIFKQETPNFFTKVAL